MATMLVVVSVIVVASVAAAVAIVKNRSAGNSYGVGDADAGTSSADAIGDITGNNNGDSSTGTSTGADIEMMAGAETEQLMALRSVLEGRLPHLYGDDTSSSPLHDRTTAQYRALYWMANVDEVTPSLLMKMTESASDSIRNGADRDAIQERIVQRYSLVVLYYATSGEGWRNQYGFLNTTLDECEWGIRDEEENADDDGHDGATQTSVKGEGVAECTDEGFVTALSLSKNRLKTQVPGGGIPEELFELTRLEFLVLGGNNFAGALSPRISQLTRLYYLNIRSTRLEGEIPDLSTLEQINVFLGCCNDFVNLPTFPMHPRSNFLRSVDLANNRIAVNVEDHAEYATFPFIHTLEIEGNPIVGSFNFLCDANPTIYISIDEDRDVDCYCCTFV